MEKIKKNKKFLFLTILIVIAIVGSFFVYNKNYDFSITNKIKEVNADTCKQLSDGKNHCCSTVGSEADGTQKLKATYCAVGTKNYNKLRCKQYTEVYNVLKKFQCESCKAVPAGYAGWVYSNGQCVKGRYLGACGDGSDSHNSFSNGNILGYSGGHPITRVEVSGHVAFCIQPEVWYSKCGSYSTSGASVSVNDNIAKIVWAFNHSNKSNEAYMAAQSMIWGTEIIGDADEIYRNMPGSSSTSETHSVSLDQHEISVNLNDTVVVNDKNGTLGNYAGNFNITTSGGVDASRNNNSISITANSIYPLTKTVSVNTAGNNPEVTGTDGNISYTRYNSSSSQDFVAFASGTLGNINYKYFNGDTVTLKLATGSLEIRKIDSFNRPVTSGTKFKVYFPNGQEFALEDGTNEFTVDDNGYLLISGLPSGGKLADGTPVGKYTVKEVSTTNAYNLNANEYTVEIKKDTTSTLTVQNSNVLHKGGVTVFKHDEWNRAIEEGTTFKVYYATTDCNDAVETGTLNGVTYCKKVPFVSLNDKAEGKNESIYTIGKDGTLTIKDELPIGGQFADHTPVGIYIIQEAEPSSAYKLNPNLFVFDASKEDEAINIDVEDENVKGNLKINKLDEYGRKTDEGIKFTLAYATKDENDNWIDYQDFISAEDFKAGKTEATIFTTDKDGVLEIKDILPVGGTFPNTDVKIGNYILHEVCTINAYVLNENGMFIPLKANETVEGDFLNDLRTVSFTVSKQDEEENYRKLNEAEFTIYDISDVLDLNMKFDSLEDCTAHNGIWNKENNKCSYKTQTITFTKLGNNLDMETILKTIHPETEKIIDGKPVRYELSQPSLATITPFGKMTSKKIGNLTVKVLGGGYDLWVSDGDAKVYDDEKFNPYDITFYSKGADGAYYQLETKSVEITNEQMPDFTQIGEYELSYKVTSTRNVVYEFTRKISVIKDNRHLCLDSGTVNADGEKIYRYLDTKDICPKEEAVEIIPSHNKETVPVIVTNKDIDKEWADKLLYTLELKIIQNNDSIMSADNEIKQLFPIFKGKTGHSYFQVIDKNNHNLYIQKEEMLLYADKELTKPVLKYIGDNSYGVYDLDSSYWEAYKPKDTLEETVKELLTEDSTEEKIENYYYKDFDNQAVEVKLDVKQEKGKLNIPNLKHSRTYLLSESGLPEGYDFSENTNSAYIFDTYDYKVDEVEHFTDINNKLRRIDMILSKTNSDGSVKLDGALFDVYETFEEGLDMNIIDKTKDNLDLGTLKDGREYYKEALGQVKPNGTCEAPNSIALDEEGNLIDIKNATYKVYEDDNDYGKDNPLNIDLYKLVDGKYVKVELDYQETFNVNKYNEANPDDKLYVMEAFTGTCHMLYTPNTVQRKYLGRYLTGGIYEAYVYDAEGKIKLLNNTAGNLVAEYEKTLEGEVEIAIDKDFLNIVKTVKLNNGVLETTLSDGVYYTRLKQPTRLVEIKAPETETTEDSKPIETVKKEELIPYDELDPQYQVVNKYKVQKGKFTLENIKYFHNLEYVEVKAPTGYQIKNHKTTITPSAPYGTDYMDNSIANDIIPISSKTGVNPFRMWENNKVCVAK